MKRQRVLGIVFLGMVFAFVGGAATLLRADSWVNESNWVRPNASWSSNVNITGYTWLLELNVSGMIFEQGSRVCTPANGLCPGGSGSDNTSWNQSHANTLYYLRTDGNLDNSSWSQSFANTKYVQLNGTLTNGKVCLWSGNDLDCNTDPVTNNNQLSNGAGYLTDDTSVPKNHLTSTGTLGFTWSSSEITEADGSTTNELQNLFQTISTTSGSAPVADSTTDTLTLTAGSGITITGDSTTDTITIAATGSSDGITFSHYNTTHVLQSTTSNTVYTTMNTTIPNLLANSRYQIDCDIIHDAAAVTTGLVINVTFSGATSGRATWSSPSSATAIESFTGTGVTSAGNNFLDTGSNTVAAVGNLDGWVITGGSAVTWKVDFRSEVSGSAVNVREGSFCRAVKVA